MTKPITSAAVMMLAEEGKVDLDAPVSEYIPEFEGLRVFAGQDEGDTQLVAPEATDDRPRPLEAHLGAHLRLLRQHASTSNIRLRESWAPFDDLQRTIDKLARLPLLHHPGDKFNYSVSTDVLGHLVEKVSGESLADFFATRIFEPLGMEDTGFHVPENKHDRFVNNYGPNDGEAACG